MSAPDPITDAELAALLECGCLVLDTGQAVDVADLAAAALRAYRAGFADGRTQPEPRVYHAGDPEPGPQVAAVLDADGDTWGRCNSGWGLPPGGSTPWDEVLSHYGPVVAGLPSQPYDDAVRADATERARLSGQPGHLNTKGQQ